MSGNYLDIDGINGRINSFDKRHGGAGESVFANGWILYSDGARRESDPMGALNEPPEDPHQCAKYILLFHKIRMEKAIKEFDSHKRMLAGMAHANLQMANSNGVCNPPPQLDDAIAELNRLATKAKKAKADFDNAQANVEKSTPSHLRQRDIQNTQNRQSNESFLAQIIAIEV